SIAWSPPLPTGSSFVLAFSLVGARYIMPSLPGTAIPGCALFFAVGALPSVHGGGDFSSSLLCARGTATPGCALSFALGALPSVYEGGDFSSSLLCALCALLCGLCVNSFSLFAGARGTATSGCALSSALGVLPSVYVVVV